MIQSSDDCLVRVIGAIIGPNAGANPPTYPTDADGRVYTPRDWPNQPDQYPIIKGRVQRESMVSLSRSGAPSFTVTTTVVLNAEVSAAALPDDAGANAAEAAVASLDRQVKVAVINSYPLTREIQKIASVNTVFGYNASGETHLGAAQISLDIEWFADPSIFAPVVTVPLAGVDVNVTTFQPTGISIALPQ